MKASGVEESEGNYYLFLSHSERSSLSWKFASKREHSGRRSFANLIVDWLQLQFCSKEFSTEQAQMPHTSTLLKQMCNSVARTSFVAQAAREERALCFR